MISHFKQKRKNYLLIIILIIIAVIGTFLILYISSNWGVGLNPDSVAYISAAQNILNGKGVVILYNEDGTIPLNLWTVSKNNPEISLFLWPPFYPIFLTIPKILNFNLISGARFLNAILFGLNIILIGIIIFKYSSSFLLSIFGSTILMISETMLSIHTHAISEPLFIFLGFLGLYLMSNYLENYRIKFLILSSLCISLASLTRYIGISFVVTAATGILFLSHEKIGKKLINLTIFILISCLPMFIWLTRLWKIGEMVREPTFYHFSLDDIKAIPVTILKWFSIKEVAWFLSIIIICILVAVFILGLIFISKKNKLKTNNHHIKEFPKIVKLSTIFIFAFFLFLIISRAFFEGGFRLSNNRILSPIFIAILIIILFSISLLLTSNKKNPIIKIFVILVCLTFISLHTINIFKYSVDKYNNGQGYLQEYFITSETIKEINKIPEDIYIYSNAPDIIYLFTKRPAVILPFKESAFNLDVNENYLKEISIIIDKIKNKKGVIVYFNGVTRDYLPTAKDLKKEFPLCLLSKQSDGFIYEVCSMPKNTIFETNSSNFTDYWKPLVDCKFDVSGEKVWIKVTGKDPYFESKFPIKFKDKSPLILKVLMESPIESEFRIFYGKPGEPYIFEESDGYPVKKGENEIYFRIPYMKDLERIRIDPIDAKEDCIIREIKLFNVPE